MNKYIEVYLKANPPVDPEDVKGLMTEIVKSFTKTVSELETKFNTAHTEFEDVRKAMSVVVGVSKRTAIVKFVGDDIEVGPDAGP